MLTGDLCNENQETANGSFNTTNNKHKTENGKAKAAINQTAVPNASDIDTVDSGPGLAMDTSQFVATAPARVSKGDRNKFSGSLPNHLDSDDVCEENGRLS